MKDLIDASRLTPGVVVSPQISGGRTIQTFTIRGIGYDDFRPNGNPSAAVSIDGAYQGSAALVGGQMFDVERIEILKGPQGTLYGQNTTAGAVNIISRQPTDTWEGRRASNMAASTPGARKLGRAALWPMASSCGWRASSTAPTGS